jgi:uncharacterized protein DUF1844
MPDRKEEEQQEFKVVDRRLFTADGERRSDVAPEPEMPAAAAVEPVAPAAAPQKAVPPADERRESPAAGPAAGAPPSGVQFEHLIMSLVTSAMYQLGMAARPGEQPLPPDLPAAQETIDLLGLVQKKTHGNLTAEENELLTGSLQELRLAFVELTRRAGRIR